MSAFYHGDKSPQIVSREEKLCSVGRVQRIQFLVIWSWMFWGLCQKSMSWKEHKTESRERRGLMSQYPSKGMPH